MMVLGVLDALGSSYRYFSAYL